MIGYSTGAGRSGMDGGTDGGMAPRLGACGKRCSRYESPLSDVQEQSLWMPFSQSV
jgi:hypothetical protein